MLTRRNLLGDRYRLDERIASGGMGEVWKATDTALGRTVALKVLRDALVRLDGTVVLVDFGVAQSPDATSVTAAGQVVGTALYMAPEQATGRSLSPATDIYALGAVGYHCLTGRPPFPGEFAAAARAARVAAAPGEPRGGWRLPALASLPLLLLLLGIAGLAILMSSAHSRGGSAPADRPVPHQAAAPVTSQQPTIHEPGRSVATIVPNRPGMLASGITGPPAAPLPRPDIGAHRWCDAQRAAAECVAGRLRYRRNRQRRTVHQPDPRPGRSAHQQRYRVEHRQLQRLITGTRPALTAIREDHRSSAPTR